MSSIDIVQEVQVLLKLYYVNINMINEFEKEEKLSGGAVFERGVKQSKEHKAIRRIAEPLMEKHWKNEVTNLHRIYKVAEYLFKRSKRPK